LIVGKKRQVDKDPGMGMKFVTVSAEDLTLIQACIQDNIVPAAASTNLR
jgi:hypothetical protein